MKTSQILYLLVFVGVVICIVTGTHLLDGSEGFQSNQLLPVNSQSEPVTAKGIEATHIDIQVTPNSSTPGTLPFGPYGQMAAAGSYQYRDPAQLPAELIQMKQLYEDIQLFLEFEGASVSSSSDPTVQLPLTQLRADSNRLGQEISVLTHTPGIRASLTQQDTADIQGALSFLQRKVRLFQTSGVISDQDVEGFQSDIQGSKTRATLEDLKTFQTKIYAAILTLSSSGTTDPTVQARIKRLQDMYSDITEMIHKLDNGTWTAIDIPVFEQDINTILPNLANPKMDIMNTLGPSKDTIKKKGASRVNVEGYKNNYSRYNHKGYSRRSDSMQMGLPFDTIPGAEENNSKVGGLDWKNRAATICEQVRLRGLDPLDFGCIAKGSAMSPAYSWRGHTKMICGRLESTMDPNLPVVCGCPPSNWPKWNSF